MATTPRKDLPGTNAPNWSQRVTEELRVLMGRAGNGRALTARDLIDSGIAKPGAGGGLVPGVPGGGDSEPDLTPPPVPTGFTVTAGLSTVFVEHDAPGYTQGHGHDRTVVYGVLQTGSTAPTFDQAVVLFQFQGTIGAYPAALGTRYRLWIKWQSQDGVQSASPAGGTNGLDVQTGKIGNNDLGPLIVEAGNLANGAVSANKLAAQAVDATKFAAGIEPVSVSTAGTLPTVKSTTTIVWQGKLYRWDGSKYSASVPTVDLTGTIIASQIAAGAIDATKFASGIEPVTNSAAASLPTVKSTTVITWQGKLYRWDGTKYTAEVAVVDLSGQIDAAKLADNAVTVSKIAAGAVEAGKLAAGAVTADKIAAAAVDTTKFASGIEPVTNSTASTLPTVKSTTTITWQGKLYRWDGSKYTAAVPTTDLTGTVASAQIADSAVTLAKIATGSVDTTKFAAGIEPVSNSTAGTLPTVKSTTVITWQGKLYRWDGSKYSAEVAVGDMVGQIAATQIADNAITTPKLAANAVVADKIAANAVLAAALSADAVTAGKIAAGAVNTRELAANSVTASKLVITATDTVNVDPFFQDGSIWSGINWSRKVGEVGSPGPFVLSSLVNQANLFNGSWTPIDISRTYLFETWFKAFGSHANRAFASIRFYDVNGTALINADAPSIGWPGANASAGNYYFPAVGTTTPQEWTRYTLTVGPNGVAKFPPKAAFFVVGAFLNYSGATPVVESQWGGIRITEMARGELVVDGAITASKMTLTDSTNFVPDPDFRDYAAWSVGAVQNFSFEDGEVADNTQRVATYTTALRTGSANAYIGEFVQQPRISMETGRQVFISVKIRDYLGAEGRVDLGIATTKAAGTTYSNVSASRVLGTADGYVTLTATYVVAADDVAIGWRVRWQYSAAGRFVGPFKVMNPVLRVMGQAELMVDGAITAAKIATGAVTAGKIAAGAVTAGTIAANVVTANEIAANAITTAKIQAGAVTTGELAAGSVTASKMVLTDTSNAYPDFDMADVDGYTSTTAFTFVSASSAYGGRRVVSINAAAAASADATVWAYATNGIQLEANSQYLVSMQTARQAASAATLQIITRLGVKTSATAITWAGEALQNSDTAASANTYKTFTLTTSATQTRLMIGMRLLAGAVTGGYFGSITIRKMNGAELIVDGAVSAVKIAAKTLTAAQIAAGTITASEIAAGTITAGNIATGAITANELATNSVTAIKVAAGAITAGKIAANAVTANEIAANAITTAKIAAGAVSATELAAGSVLASKLVVSDTSTMVPDAEYQDASMWFGVSGGTVALRANEPNANAGTVSKCVLQINRTSSAGGSSAYDGGASSTFAVAPSTDYVLRMAIYSPQACTIRMRMAFFTPAGVSRSIDTDYTYTGSAWVSHEIKARSGAGESYAQVYVYIREDSTTSYVYVGKMRFQEAAAGALIVDGAIIAAKLATNSVTANAIAANSVTTNAIAANAVTANEIAANSITAAKIATGAVNADQIAANAILASKLVISDQSNMLADTEFRDLVYWYTNCTTSTDAAAVAAIGVTPVLTNPTGTTANMELYNRNSGYYLGVEPGRTYKLSIQVYIAAGWNGRGQLNAQGYAANGTTGTTSTNAYTADYRTNAATGATTVTLTLDYTATAATSFVRFRFLATYTNAAVAGLFIGRPRMWLKQDADLIVDGAIVASKIAAGAIAVGTAAIQDGAIVNAMIGNGAIDNAKIAVAAIDTAKIANGAIQNANIANAAVDNAKISNMSAAKLTAGALAVGSYINSSNYISGSQGWSINANGQAEFSGVIVRGTIYSNAGSIGGISINGNGLNAGAYTGYAWPAGTGTGFHLGPNGLLLGNPSTGRYVELNAGGDIYTPGFRVVNGVMTVLQANVIDTLQIKGGAITAVVPRWRGNYAFYVSTNRTLDEFAVSAEYQNIVYLEWVNNIGGDGLYLSAYRGDGENGQIVSVPYPGAYARVELQFYANGSYMGTASVEVFQGIGNYVITPMFAVPLGATGVLVNMPPISRNSPEGQRSLNNTKITIISIKR